jgi:hypothetical protein
MSHNLTVYDDDDHLATRVAAFLDAGIERGEAAIAVVDERKWALLCDALGPARAHRPHRPGLLLHASRGSARGL